MFTAIVLFMLPFLVGACFHNSHSAVEQYVKGAMTELVVFGVCYFITLFGLRTNALHILTSLFLFAITPFIIIGISKLVKWKTQFAGCLSELQATSAEERALVACLLLFVGYQVMRVALFTPTQVRDSIEYDPLVLRMVESGLIYGPPATDAFSADQLLSISTKYIVTPWYVYEAVLSKITGLHALIITKTWIPIYVLVLTYLSLFMLANEIFQEKKQKALFVLICGFLFEMRLILGEQSAYMLVWPSWGKNVTSSITTVLLLVFFLRIMEECDEKKNAIWIFACSFVGAGASAAAMLSTSVELFALMIVFTLKKRKLQPIWYAIIGEIPCIAQFFVYYAYSRGAMNQWLLGSIKC